MDIKKIRKWVRPMDESQVTLDNTWGNRKILRLMQGSVPDAEMMSRLLFRLPEKKCFFYYGPEGTGKSQMAIAFAGSMRTKANYECYTVCNNNLAMASDQDIMLVVDEVVKAAESSNVFFYLENPGRQGNGQLLLNCMMDAIQNIQNLHLAFVVSDTDINILRTEWKREMVICRFELPNEEERKNYLQQEMGAFTNGLETVYIASATEGFDYAQLKLLAKNLKQLVRQKYLEDYLPDMRTQFCCSQEEVDLAIAEIRIVEQDKALSTQEIRQLFQQITDLMREDYLIGRGTLFNREVYRGDLGMEFSSNLSNTLENRNTYMAGDKDEGRNSSIYLNYADY